MSSSVLSPRVVNVAQHGVFWSFILHLSPGAVALLAYLFASAPLAAALGLPPQAAFVIMDVFVLIPVLLGSLFLLGRKTTGRWTLEGVVLYRDRLRWPR